MNPLAWVSLLLGLATGLVCGWMVLYPAAARRAFAAFPRSRIAGIVLATVDLGWSAWWVLHMPLGSFERYKPLVYFAAPVVWFAVVFLMDELLASRALGGLFLLLPAPMLSAARWHPSPWRLVVVVLAYLMVIKGMALTLSPWLFRKSAEIWLSTDRRCRLVGAAGLVLAALLVALCAVY